MADQERFDTGEWIEEAAAGVFRPVPSRSLDALLRRLREYGLVLPLARGIAADEPASSELINAAVARAALLRSACLQELESALYALLQARIPAAVRGATAAYLALPAGSEADCELSESEIQVPEQLFVDAQRALGRAGFRAKDEHSPWILMSAAGSPPVRLARMAPEELSEMAPNRLRGMPTAVLSTDATGLMADLMRDFSRLGVDSLRLLGLARSVLRSDLGTQVDWLRLAKRLAQNGVMGQAVVGFHILSTQWDLTLGEPIASLVSARTRGLSGEVLRTWFSPSELLRPQVPQMRRLLGRMTALR
jgi:hypothetical protein